MKLTPAQIEHVRTQLDLEPMGEDHEAYPALVNRFGDHSFFLNADGLHIVEPNVTARGEDRTGALVTLASWADETRAQLRPHAPKATAHIVELGRPEAGGGQPDPPGPREPPASKGA